MLIMSSNPCSHPIDMLGTVHILIYQSFDITDVYVLIIWPKLTQLNPAGCPVRLMSVSDFSVLIALIALLFLLSFQSLFTSHLNPSLATVSYFESI